MHTRSDEAQPQSGTGLAALLPSLRGGWALATLGAVVATVLASVGSITFVMTSSARSARGAAHPHLATPSPDLDRLVQGQIRIESTRRAHLLRGGPAQLVVDYRASSSRKLLTMVLAWDRSRHSWQSVYDGSAASSPGSSDSLASSDVLVPSGSTTEDEFALGLIEALNTMSDGRYKIPATSANEALIEIWMVHEGGLWANNPLNTSLDAADYPHQITSSGEDTGIPIYPDLQVGIEDTAETLLGNPAYADILAALASGSGSCIAFGSAVVESPWAASHYGYDAGSFCPSGTEPELTASTASLPAPTPAPSPVSTAGRAQRSVNSPKAHHKARRSAGTRGGTAHKTNRSKHGERAGRRSRSSGVSSSATTRRSHGLGETHRTRSAPPGSGESRGSMTTHRSEAKTDLLPVARQRSFTVTNVGHRAGRGHRDVKG